jgi:hypothetical protein
MRSFRLYLLFIPLFLIINRVFSQDENCVLDSLPEYEFIDTEICHTLDIFFDSLMVSYYQYSILKQPFLTFITFDSSEVSITTTAYSCSVFSYQNSALSEIFPNYHPQIKEYGYSFYRDHLLLISSFDTTLTNLFFKKNGNYQKIIFHNSDNILDHIVTLQVNVDATYNYVDGRLILDDDFQGSERDVYEYLYLIKKDDTWNSIAQKMNCSVSDLTNGYEERLPIPGCYLLVRFYFENDKVFVERLQ